MSRRTAYRAFALLLVLLIATALGGCKHDMVGTLNLQIEGVPAPGVQNVVLAIKGIEVGDPGGQTDLPFGSEIQLDVESGRNSLLDSLIPVGDYQWVRLELDPAQSYVIASNGNRYPLDVPSVYQTNADFTMGEGLTANLLLYIDLRTALSSQTQGGATAYMLKPAQLMNLDDVSAIFGTVSTGLVIGNLSVNDPNCAPSVYVYPGAGAVPEGFYVPVKGGTAPFVSSSAFILHTNQNLYSFNVMLLPPGTYTAAVTCAAEDIPGSNSIAFSPTQTVVITLAANSILNF